VHESFLSQKIFCGFSDWKELENEKFERVNENENKENENVDEFQEYILAANTEVKAESDMKAWMPYNRSTIVQAISVKVAGYWTGYIYSCMYF